jgi:hypothetical protein
MPDAAKLTVYCHSYLTSTAANELAASVFGTVVIPLHDPGDAMLRQNIQRLGEKHVLFSIAGRCSRETLESAIRYYGVDGVDLESDANIDDVAQWAAAMRKIVVGSPSDRLDRWIGALRTPMSWWNLQLYNGADYAAWVGAIVASGAMSGEQAQRFVVPGYKLTWSTPASVAHDLEGLRDYAPFVDGVFLRTWEEMQPRAVEWTQAITSGLGAARTILAS